MTKPVLDVLQMQHLKELGMDTSNASMCWTKVWQEFALSFHDEKTKRRGSRPDSIPAYTLQDLLDALPDFIDEYCLIIDMSFGVIRYDNLKRKDGPILKEAYFNNEDKYLIDAAYEMLCWCVENGHLKMKRNENKSI